MAAAAVALYAMLGFESAAVAAGRVKDPQRTIPRATLIGTLVVAVLYVAIVAIGMLVVPQATLATSDAPFVTITDHLLGPGNGRWVSLFVVISGLGCLNGWTLLSGELTRTLAAHRLLPAILGEDNRFGAPWASLLLTGALATFIGLMNYSSTLVGAFTKLSLIVSAANLPLYVCCSFALFALLRRGSRRASPRDSGSRASAASHSPHSRSRASAGSRSCGRSALGVAGVPIYLLMRRRQASRPSRRRCGRLPGAACSGCRNPRSGQVPGDCIGRTDGLRIYATAPAGEPPSTCTSGPRRPTRRSRTSSQSSTSPSTDERYGRLVTTLPVPGRGNRPHHTEHEMPADGQLFANGFATGQSFVFDLTDPDAAAHRQAVRRRRGLPSPALVPPPAERQRARHVPDAS